MTKSILFNHSNSPKLLNAPERKVKHAPEQSFIELFEIGLKGITLLQKALKRVTLQIFMS